MDGRDDSGEGIRASAGVHPPRLVLRVDRRGGGRRAGVVLAAQVPLQWGLGFAGVLALFGILCSLSQTRMRVISLAVAGAAAVAAYALPMRLNILVAIAAAVAFCMVIEQTPLAGKQVNN